MPIERNCATGALSGRTETAKALETERTVAIMTVTRLAGLAEAAERTWREPDQGIWEIRSDERVFTTRRPCAKSPSTVPPPGRLSLPGPVAQWAICGRDRPHPVPEEAWGENAKTLCEHVGGGGVDASLLALPRRQVVPAGHPAW